MGGSPIPGIAENSPVAKSRPHLRRRFAVCATRYPANPIAVTLERMPEGERTNARLNMILSGGQSPQKNSRGEYRRPSLLEFREMAIAGNQEMCFCRARQSDQVIITGVRG